MIREQGPDVTRGHKSALREPSWSRNEWLDRKMRVRASRGIFILVSLYTGCLLCKMSMYPFRMPALLARRLQLDFWSDRWSHFSC